MSENIVYFMRTEVENRCNINEKKLYIGATEKEWK